MNMEQGAFALGEMDAQVDPHGWFAPVEATASVLAVCAVSIVVVLCITIIVLVKSTEPNQRVAAIKALAPTLLALATRFAARLGTRRRS